MSLLGALNTAVSGLSSQSAAFGNISDNVANAQTVGYKAVNTSFEDYLTTSSATVNDSGAVVATPSFANDAQGTIAQTSDPLNLAITGQGFFAVSEANSAAASSGTQTNFSSQPYYTRAGDFSLDKNGYIVNSSGEFLNGWPVDASTGAVDQNLLAPIQVSQSVYKPVATTQVNLTANLPATPSAPTSTTPISSQVTVYDSLGTAHVVTLQWTQTINSSTGNPDPSDWTLALQVPSASGSTPTTIGTADVQFGAISSGNTGVPEGTIGSISNLGSSVPASQTSATSDPGIASTSPFALNDPATLTFVNDFGSGPQTITLNLGNYGSSDGVTQYAGTSYSLQGLTQNGDPPGSYSSVTTNTSGDIIVNYNNGQSRTIAQVPIVTFNSPDSLQREDGQAFTSTQASGNPNAESVGTNGAGSLVTGSVEQSNIDIASQFTKLIVAQQAYSANTKVVTTANDLLQQTISMTH